MGTLPIKGQKQIHGSALVWLISQSEKCFPKFRIQIIYAHLLPTRTTRRFSAASQQLKWLFCFPNDAENHIKLNLTVVIRAGGPHLGHTANLIENHMKKAHNR